MHATKSCGTLMPSTDPQCLHDCGRVRQSFALMITTAVNQKTHLQALSEEIEMSEERENYCLRSCS